MAGRSCQVGGGKEDGEPRAARRVVAVVDLDRPVMPFDDGAGDGQAILDYYAGEGSAPSSEKCARPGAKVTPEEGKIGAPPAAPGAAQPGGAAHR